MFYVCFVLYQLIQDLFIYLGLKFWQLFWQLYQSTSYLPSLACGKCDFSHDPLRKLLNLHHVQCQTAKINKFASARSGFFQGKWTLELWSGCLKTSKNTLLETFTCFLPLDDFFFKFLYIMPYQISKLVVTFITQIITCCHSVRFKLRQQCRNGTCGKYRLRGVF